MARKTNAQLELEIQALRNDLAKANEFLNDRAERHSLCDEYEEMVGELNKVLASDFRFKPRGEEYGVRMEVSINRQITVPVYGRDMYSAKDNAEYLGEREVFRLAGIPEELYEALYGAEFDIETEVLN